MFNLSGVLEGLCAIEAVSILVAGLLCLASLLYFGLIRRPWPPFAVGVAVCGLWLIAMSCDALKNTTPSMRFDQNPHFRVLRNLESLSLITIPVVLVAFRHPRAARAAHATLGLAGVGLLALIAFAGTAMTGDDGRLVVQSRNLPGAAILDWRGAVAFAHWIWVAGCLALAWPTARVLLARQREMPHPHFSPDATMIGLALSSLAMSIFYWHASDVRHREYAIWSLSDAALLSCFLAIGHSRTRMVKWISHAFGGIGALLAFWLLTGAAGADFATGKQSLMDPVPSGAYLALLVVAPPILILYIVFRLGRLQPPAGRGP